MTQRVPAAGRGTATARGTATRERILAAAVARFASQGFRDTSVAAIARDTGVTAPAVHAHFATKQELFHTAFQHDVGPVLDALDNEAGLYQGLSPDGATAGAGLIQRVAAELGRHPLARRVFSGGEPALTRELMALPVVSDAHDRLARRVTAGQQAGVLRADLPAGDLAGAVEAIVFALLLGTLQMGVPPAERRKAIAAVISQGLLAR
jgi:AcrR family transcriptional regulator